LLKTPEPVQSDTINYRRKAAMTAPRTPATPNWIPIWLAEPDEPDSMGILPVEVAELPELPELWDELVRWALFELESAAMKLKN
jgi:hypothetical protein